MKLLSVTRCFITLLALLHSLTTSAQPPSPAPGGHDPQALQLMLASSQTMRQLPSAYLESVTTTSATGAGQQQSKTLNAKLWKSGPAKFYLVMQSPAEGSLAAVISNGTEVLTYVPSLKQYIIKPYSSNPETLVPGGLLTIDPTINLLFSNDTIEDLRRETTSIAIAGTENVDGIATTKIRMTTGTMTMELWLKDGETPLPVKWSATVPTGVFTGRVENSSRWVLQPVAESFFQLQPPAGATRVEQFSAPGPATPTPAGAAASSSAQQPGTGVQVGSMAPDFSLLMGDGRQFQLSSRRGQAVVVLDFFATWCGPCRASMPGVEQAANKFPGQVELYAVNLREPTSKVQKFLQQLNVKAHVLFDSKGQVAGMYGARSIPYLVIIDKNGIVRSVERGLPRDSAPFVEALIRKTLAAQ